MLRILFVCTVPTEKSGIPNVIFNLIGAMDTSGMAIGYVSINNPEPQYKQQLKAKDVKLFVIPREIKHPLKYINKLQKIARNYDVIHVHGNSATMVLEMLAAKFAGVKLRIAHSHNTTCTLKKIDRLARPLFYWLCNGRLACGFEAGKWLFQNRDFLVINNGIKTETFRFSSIQREVIRHRLGIGKRFAIGHVGNFNEQKNQTFLIDIFFEYHRLNNKSTLLLLGDGPIKDEIRHKVDSMGMNEDVLFLGSVDHPEDYLSAMDIVVMPSLFEGLPLTLIEEQANGLNILASDVITQDSNLTGLVRFKSLNDSAAEWAKEIQLLSTQVDRSSSMSNESIEMIKVAGYDIKTASDDLKAYYNRKISG